MTIIAYKDGIIAADSATFSGQTIINQSTMKIAKSKKGILGGATGSSTFCQSFRDWIMRECKGKVTFPKDDFGIISRPGATGVEAWDENGVCYYQDAYHAIGAGDDFALGVMWAGGSAIDAVKAAIHHSAFCSGTVNWLKR